MNLKLHPEYGFARVIYLGEHAMDWALDKIGSPAHESSGEEDLLAAAGIGTIVRRGKVRNYARLNDLLKQNVTAKELDPAVTPLLQLATSAITANAISLALQAAVTVGNVAYRAVQAVTSNTIGVYRVSFLQVADNFGAGKHPEIGYLDIKDLSFNYEILAE